MIFVTALSSIDYFSPTFLPMRHGRSQGLSGGCLQVSACGRLIANHADQVIEKFVSRIVGT